MVWWQADGSNRGALGRLLAGKSVPALPRRTVQQGSQPVWPLYFGPVPLVLILSHSISGCLVTRLPVRMQWVYHHY